MRDTDAAFECIHFEMAGSVATVTLNRPEVLNAMNLRMRDELWSILDVVEADDDVGVLVFQGAGDRAFCSGADITEFGTAPSLDASRRAHRERDLWSRLLALDKPVVAALHGYALGAGLELAMCCDFRIAAEDAVLGLPETKLGYLPSAGGSQNLPRLIGPGPAMDMILSGEPIDAARALEFGLVNSLVARQQLIEAADNLASALLSRPQRTLRAAKRAVLDGLDLPLASALALDARVRARLAVEA